MCQRIARVFFQVFVKGFDRFRIFTCFQERKSQIVKHFGIGGFQFECTPECFDGLLVFPVDNQ